MTLEEQKKVLLDILNAFTSFCDRNQLIYYLDAGTLLGAVRHEGFIPWDDDVDVCMPQNDYDIFVDLTGLHDGYLNDHIRVDYPRDTAYPFLKVSDIRTSLVEFPDRYPIEMGVYIDVFPKYGIRNRGIIAKMVCKIAEVLWLCHWFNKYLVKEWQQPSYCFFKRKFARLIELLTRKDYWAAGLQNRFIHAYARNNPFSDCKYVTTLTNGEYNKLAPITCFKDYQLLLFEGRMYKVPIDYDTYLHCLYKGDYMQLPPVENRHRHNTKVYWK